MFLNSHATGQVSVGAHDIQEKPADWVPCHACCQQQGVEKPLVAMQEDLSQLNGPYCTDIVEEGPSELSVHICSMLRKTASHA